MEQDSLCDKIPRYDASEITNQHIIIVIHVVSKADKY